MIAHVKRLWAAAPIATLVLALALAAAGLFAVRGVAFWVYWSNPARHEQAIAPWMTPGYIAHSWQVPRDVVIDAVQAPVPPPNGPITLEDLADLRGVRVETLIAEAKAAIAAWRAANPGPGGGQAMSETVFGLIADFGPVAIMVSAFLSCLALPIPTSLMMLTGGTFVATADLDLIPVVLAAYSGAVIGDQAGFMIGRYGGTPVLDRLARAPARRAVLDRARALIDRHGGLGVFFSTWAIAPLGPWVNFAAGATGLGWLRFTIADVLGEVIWVTLYVGLGYAFAANVAAVAEAMGDLMGLLAALAVAAGAALWIRAVLRAQKARP